MKGVKSVHYRWRYFLPCLLTLALIAAGFEPAADLSGKWKMTVTTKKGKTHLKLLTLEQKGEELKGTLRDEGGELAMAGTVKDNVLELTGRRMGILVKLDGTVEKDNKMSGKFRVLSIEDDWIAEKEQ